VTASTPAILVVVAGQRRVALALGDLVEVVVPTPPVPVPGRLAAFRGLTTVRGRLVPLVHLGALLEGGNAPDAPAEAAVVIAVSGRRICLEVEAVEEVLRVPALAPPPGQGLPWAAAVARTSEGLLPVLDISALGVRLMDGGA
jgi:chemotaxis signal transduction protein